MKILGMILLFVAFLAALQWWQSRDSKNRTGK